MLQKQQYWDITKGSDRDGHVIKNINNNIKISIKIILEWQQSVLLMNKYDTPGLAAAKRVH